MAKESRAERLARLKAGPEYDLAPELRYQAPDSEPVDESEISELIPAETEIKFEALRLEHHDYEQEYQWILDCHQRGIVPAVKVRDRTRSSREPDYYKLYVYPKNGRRYTVAAWDEFRAKLIRSNGFVATRSHANSAAAEQLLSYMVNVSLRDSTPERYEKALLTSPQEWLHEMNGHGGDWLSIATDNLKEGPVERAWLESEHYDFDVVSQNDCNVYLAYLEDSDVKIIPRTSASEHASQYLQRPEAEYKDFFRRNRTRLPIDASELETYFAGKTWSGWDNFHASWPDAPGLLSLSAVGYDKDHRRAFFTAFNRCDPRLLVSSNAESGSLEYLERVWLENTPNGWRVQDKVRLHAYPSDFGPQGLTYSSGSVNPTFTAASLLDDIKVYVYCEGPEELQIGFRDERPVAFFTIDGTSCGQAVGAIIGGPETRTFEPPETRQVQRLEFQLDRRNLALGEGLHLKEILEHESVVVTVYVWMDGDWRRGSAVLEPNEAESELCDYTTVEHHPLVLDCLFDSLFSE